MSSIELKDDLPAMSEMDAAWLAGFVDGEGYIGIVKHDVNLGWKGKHGTQTWYSPRLQIAGTDAIIMEYIRNMLRHATLSTTNKQNPKWKPYICLVVPNLKDIQRVLSLLTPYLRLKKKQALLLSEFVELRLKAPDHVGWGKNGYGKRELEIYSELRRLNRKGRLEN